jgi:hypothetical protein
MNVKAWIRGLHVHDLPDIRMDRRRFRSDVWLRSDVGQVVSANAPDPVAFAVMT